MRYLLFSGERYYPAGGAGDLYGAFATLEEAQAAAKKTRYDWWHIFDLKTLKTIEASG